jgi:hypothetical protein
LLKLLRHHRTQTGIASEKGVIYTAMLRHHYIALGDVALGEHDAHHLGTVKSWDKIMSCSIIQPELGYAIIQQRMFCIKLRIGQFQKAAGSL